MTQIRDGILALATFLSLSSAAAAAPEVVYQRTQSNGTLTLTNVPERDGEGYQVMMSGPRDGAGGDLARAGGASGSADGPARRAPDVPPSMEARTGGLLKAEEAPAAAAEMARQAQDQINAAGGVRERMLDLYQASAAAFRDKQAGH